MTITRLVELKDAELNYQSGLPSDKDALNVFISGGVGDNILGMPVVRELARRHPVNVYSHHADAYNYFKGPEDPDHLGRLMNVDKMDFWLEVNSVLRPHFQSTYEPKHRFQSLLDLIRDCATAHPAFEYAYRKHPKYDDTLTAIACKAGYTRQTLPFAFMGMSGPDVQSRVSIQGATPNKAPRRLQGVKYVTMHNGYEVMNPNAKPGSSTKNWPVEKFSELAWHLGLRGYKVIQLGLKKTSTTIEDAEWPDTTLHEAFDILSGAALHIDGDSGLMHAAHQMKIPQVTIWGSTPSIFFGYSDSTNIVPKECGNCFWVVDDWMEKCPLGDFAPRCLNSIDVETVYRAAIEALEPKRTL